MAACSELELEGKSPQEKRLLCSKSFDSTTNKDDAFNAQKTSSSEMPQTTITIEESKNTVDIGSLTVEQLQSLLEEATTFNRPKDEASSILRALRKQIKDSDDVKEAASATGNTSSSATPVSVTSNVTSHSSNSSKRKTRNPGNVPCHRGRLLPCNDDTLMGDYTNFLQLSKTSESGRHCVANFDQKSPKELQSQSLQDLASARFSDTHDSMRAAGIGRGNRRLQKAGRANSFTENTCEWTGIGAQISTLDKTQARLVKSCKPRPSTNSRSSWTGQMVVNTPESDNSNALGISPSAVKLPNDPYVLFSDVTSGETFGDKLWCARSSDSSSPDKEDLQLDNTPLSSCDTDESGVRLLSCKPLNDSEFCPISTRSTYDCGDIIKSRVSPYEIEMIDMAKVATVGEVGDCGSSFVCKGLQDGYSEVDAPMTFPLKTVPSGHNNMNCTARSGPVNGMYQLSDCFPDLRKDIKYQNTTVDFNSNPVVRTMRLQEVTGFGTACGNYSFDGALKNELSISGAHGRKMKRTKSNAESSVKILAEDCDGYRGKDDIDSLVEFINSTDKNKANHSHAAGITATASVTFTASNNPIGSNNNTNKCKGNGAASVSPSSSAKNGNGSVDAVDRKKATIIKEKSLKIFKKKVTSSESADDEDDMIVLKQVNCESRETYSEDDAEHIIETEMKDDNANNIVTKFEDCDISQEKFEASVVIESFENEPAIYNAPVLPLPLSLPSGSHLSQNEDLVSSFAKDFYSVTELGGQLIEESEFRVVVNKQRKRKQPKKPDGFRRYGNSGSTISSGMGSGGSSERDYYLQESPCHHSMLLSGLPLSHRSQRGQSDYCRRKSTSSMPPSEPSSADNSDLDSVHSLPVSGTAPPQTGPHPHTTPSSMSSTPQASYADIARMSTQNMMTHKKGHDILQPSSNPGHNLTLAVSYSANPNPPPVPTTVSAAVQTSALDIMESEETQIQKQESLCDADAPEPEAEAADADYIDTQIVTLNNAVSGKGVPLVSPDVTCPAANSSACMSVSTPDVPITSGKSAFPSPPSEENPKAANNNKFVRTGNPGSKQNSPVPFSNAKQGNPIVLVAAKPSSPPSIQTCSSVAGIASTQPVSLAFSATSATLTVSPPPSKSECALVTPAVTPGPHFLQESTILCQSLNLSAKPSLSRNEPSANRKTLEPTSLSRTRPAVVHSDKKTATPVITLDKSLPMPNSILPPPLPPPICLCDISFGVDMREILQLGNSGSRNSPVMFEFEQCSHHLQSDKSKWVMCGDLESAYRHQAASAAEGTAAVKSSARESSLEESASVVVVRGKRLQWKENEAETRNFNHSQVVSFFGTAWDSVLNDFEKDTSREGKKSGKVCYYSSYC